MKPILKKLIVVASFGSLLILNSCGTITKYKSIGKPLSKKMDRSIVTLDAMGLAFFLVPGIVSFAVDFATGSIYIPKADPDAED